MRNFISLVLAFCIIMASVPTVSLFYKKELLSKSEHLAAQAQTAKQVESAEEKQAAQEKQTAADEAQAAAVEASPAALSDKVRVLLHAQNKVVEVTREFYVISVLAKEIDIAAPQEALKAQAVCIYTFLKHSEQHNAGADYAISDDPARHQAFLSKKALKAFWGDSYDKNYKTLQAVVRSVGGLYLEYDGAPALAAYHSSNAGMTESTANCWGEDYPYLRAVESIGDSLGSRYVNKLYFTPAALKKALGALKGKDFTFAESPSDWVGAVKNTPSKTVSAIEIGGVSLSGRELREALKLPSCFFAVKYQDKRFVFTVSGYGHGVGLSQEGAKYMARLGFSYRDILLHYYNGVAIKGENGV